MSQGTSARIEHTREVITYAWLWHASDKVLATGRAAAAGFAWQYLSSVILSAFALEAYLNHVGDIIIPNWEDLERPLSPIAKLRHISVALNVDLGEKGARPLQTVHDLIKARNELAHGRSETLEPEPQVMPLTGDVEKYLYEHPLTHWERRVRTPDFAERVRVDLEAIFRRLHDARPEPKEPLFHTGIHQSGAEVI